MDNGPRLPGQMPPSWEGIFKLMDGGKAKGDTGPGDAPATFHSDSDLLDIRSFPDRPWIVHSHFMRGSVTVLAGPGSAGKSMLCLAWAVAMALGRSWAFDRFRVAGPLRTMLMNVEDDNLEQQRRIHATMAQWALGPSPLTAKDLGGRVSWVSPAETGLMLRWFKEDDDFRETALFKWLSREVERVKPDVLFLDPLVELHSANENDNAALRMVVARFRAMAIALDIGIVLVHHTRKGSALSEPDDPDGVRGAGSIVGAARVVLMVRTMTAKEAEGFGIIDDTARHNYFRVDSAKQNYAPARSASWFTRDPCQVGNEIIVGAKPWQPPVTDGLLSEAQEVQVLLGIELGDAGEPWSPKLTGDDRSVVRLLERLGHHGHDFQDNLIKRLIREGKVTKQRYLVRGKYLGNGLRTGDKPAAKWREADED